MISGFAHELRHHDLSIRLRLPQCIRAFDLQAEAAKASYLPRRMRTLPDLFFCESRANPQPPLPVGDGTCWVQCQVQTCCRGIGGGEAGQALRDEMTTPTLSGQAAGAAALLRGGPLGLLARKRDQLLVLAVLLAIWQGLSIVLGEYWIGTPWGTVERLVSGIAAANCCGTLLIRWPRRSSAF